MKVQIDVMFYLLTISSEQHVGKRMAMPEKMRV